MKKLYRLSPSLKDYIWGGKKLKEYGKQGGDVIAESWELSFTGGGEATVDGVKITERFGRECWGTNAGKFEFFPSLTKFIDSRDKLSVQVHPSDAYALKHEGQYGKTEMWYIVEADEGAGIYLGFKRRVEECELRRAIECGTIEELLSFVPVKAGDVYFIPAGTVHAIGAGIVVYEIQQNSSLTYRLYDYMRRGKDGKTRELHIDKAMDVIKLDKYEVPPRDKKNADLIGECEYFKVHKYKLNFTSRELFADESSFLAVTCISGEGSVNGERICKGDTLFAPAGFGKIVITGDVEIITVSV